MGGYTRDIYGQRLGKYVSTATDTHATEERCFLRGPCRDVIRDGRGQLVVNSVRDSVKRGLQSRGR
jgi:hypothetical protein